MYHHEVEKGDNTRLGKHNYVSLFAGKFPRKTLDTLDEHGVIRVGQEVQYGDPLILAANQRDRARNKIHRKGQAGFTDASVLWKHHDPGVVTDVVHGKTGPVVLVKGFSQMQIGDKMSGRYGDKGVVAGIIPDDQMPHGADGKPYEVLLNPLGIISRTNPAQMAEAMLGKIAAITGKPVKVSDFDSVEDMTEYAQNQLKQHGLSDLEDLTDPGSGQTIPRIATGNRFFMKLHHTSESKGQGRGGGSYSLDDTPAKGGEAGCFVGDTKVRTGEGIFPIREIVMERRTLHAHDGNRITDWFRYVVPGEQLVEIELENGEVVLSTRNHGMYLANGHYRLAGLLRPGDDLLEV